MVGAPKKKGALLIPIFPLQESHLFPGIYLPLHIYEERFKAMLRYVEENKSLLAISYSPEFKSGELFPSRVCGVGNVQVVKRYENGESDILILGTERVKFKKFAQELPFLIGEGEILETDREMPEKTRKELLEEIRGMLISWFFTQLDNSERPIHFFKNVNDLELLTHFVAHYFVPDLEQKQKVLEDDRLESRAQVVWQVLKDLTGPNPKEPAPSAEVLIFPGQEPGKKTPVN